MVRLEIVNIKLLSCELILCLLCWRMSRSRHYAFWNLLLFFIGWNHTSSMKLSLIHQPTWGPLSLNTVVYTVPSTQGSINHTILCVRDVCKEVETECSISGSKNIQRIFKTRLISLPDSQFGLHVSPILFLSKSTF